MIEPGLIDWMDRFHISEEMYAIQLNSCVTIHYSQEAWDSTGG